ncbi:hypothetical protein FPV16_21885 [Methylobacterium sp. W2]|nr:hypothetical protein [Methylobacterium sp. W2]
MMQHHDELLRELGTGRIEWATPLAVFSKIGLTDDHGQSLNRDTASRTWRRVRTAVAVARQAEAGIAPRTGELVRGVRLVAPSAPPVMCTVPVPPSPVAVPPINGVDEATERIRTVLNAMGAARVPLPRQPSRIPPADARPARDRTSET